MEFIGSLDARVTARQSAFVCQPGTLSRAVVFLDLHTVFTFHGFKDAIVRHFDRSSLYNFLQRGKQAIYFFAGVVVYEADTKEAAGFFYVEALGEVQGIVVSVPGEKAALP